MKNPNNKNLILSIVLFLSLFCVIWGWAYGIHYMESTKEVDLNHAWWGFPWTVSMIILCGVTCIGSFVSLLEYFWNKPS